MNFQQSAVRISLATFLLWVSVLDQNLQTAVGVRQEKKENLDVNTFCGDVDIDTRDLSGPCQGPRSRYRMMSAGQGGVEECYDLENKARAPGCCNDEEEENVSVSAEGGIPAPDPKELLNASAASAKDQIAAIVDKLSSLPSLVVVGSDSPGDKDTTTMMRNLVAKVAEELSVLHKETPFQLILGPVVGGAQFLFVMKYLDAAQREKNASHDPLGITRSETPMIIEQTKQLADSNEANRFYRIPVEKIKVDASPHKANDTTSVAYALQSQLAQVVLYFGPKDSSFASAVAGTAEEKGTTVLQVFKNSGNWMLHSGKTEMPLDMAQNGIEAALKIAKVTRKMLEKPKMKASKSSESVNAAVGK